MYIITRAEKFVKTFTYIYARVVPSIHHGINRTTILCYTRKKYIYAVNIMGKLYISKQSIINYLATR